MALSTTTATAIIDQMITVIEALTPSSSEVSPKTNAPFRRAPRRAPLTTWAKGGSAVLRRFDIVPTGPRVDPGVMDPAATLLERELAVSVAYPDLPALYGTNEHDDMHTLAEADAVKLRDAIVSPGNHVAGQLAAYVTQSSLDAATDDVWLLRLTVLVQYYQAQTIT
ncbi:MAG: hypothetical protein AAB706_02865 [Patescibacteria group bacterium]